MKDRKKARAADCAPLQIGDVIEGAVSGISHEGMGVVRHGGNVVFVKNALPDEAIRLLVESKRRGVFFGTALDILTESQLRAEPECKLFGNCGGCALQHCSYSGQLQLKGEIVKNALLRIGKLGDISNLVRPIIGMAEPWHYRNKGVFRVSRNDEGGICLGFVEEGSHRVAAGRCSLLFPREVNCLLDQLESTLAEDEYDKSAAALTKVMVRRSQYNGEMMLILMIQAEAADEWLKAQMESLWQRLRAAIPGLKVFGCSIDHGEINPIYDNLTFFSEAQTITERLGGVRYAVSPVSFFQVNPQQAAQMLSYIRGLIPEGTGQIIDAYSGIGTIGLALAEAAQRVECIEVVPQAVADAEANCRLNSLNNVSCHCGRAEELFCRVAENCKGSGRLVVIDPPRKGCHRELLQGILDFASEHVIYVSCNPATLARDLAILSERYQVLSVQPFDMFPQSYHVETVVMLGRK